MAITHTSVRALFEHLAAGEQAEFFAHVADDVDWTVMGTHPLAGHYRSKAEFTAATFARLNPLMQNGSIDLEVVEVHVDGDHAVVELRATSTLRSGAPFDNRYCWVCTFAGDTIVAVRAYLDSALVAATLAAVEPSS